MQNLFENLNTYLVRRKAPFMAVLLVFVAVIAYLVSGVKFEENLNSIIPDDNRISEISSLFTNSELADQIVFIISHHDTATVNPDMLIEKAELLVNILRRDSSLVKEISFKSGNDVALEVYNFIFENLPLFLTDQDYEQIRTLLGEEEIETTIKKDFKSLISPAGMITKEFILKDPLSLTPIALKKLNQFDLDDNFDLYNTSVFTKDKKHLLFFLDPANPGSNIQVNRKLIKNIDQAILSLEDDLQGLSVEYYGGTAVAVANSVRVKKDILLTVSIAVVFLLTIFIVFFRRVRVIVLMFVPVILGALFSVAMLTLMYDRISAIAMGIGVIFIGISVDYSLHFFTHIRSNGSVSETIRKISFPVLISCLTTASAFLCLSIVKSEALKQIGIFTAIAIVVSALSVLIIIPQFLADKRNSGLISMKSGSIGFIERGVAYSFEKNKMFVGIILVLTIVFAFTSQNLKFNGDISTLNYQSKSLDKAEATLNSISSLANSSVYLVIQGKSLEEALTKLKSNEALFKECIAEGLVSKWSSVADIMLTGDQQKERIAQWNRFWAEENVALVKNTIAEIGKKYHFNEDAFHEFYALLDKEFESISLSNYDLLRDLLLKNYIAQEDGTVSVLSILTLESENKERLFAKFDASGRDIIIFDKLYFINQFFDVLKEDFNALVLVSTIVVFCILLLFFGRIEIALITFIPIAISWLWTMGLMGLFNLEINVFNIIISTFVFGLGIDYCIFIMNGLIANYREGNHSLAPYKLSILLSALTTIAGVGVLIFAKHPALKSIAIVSIFGISTVVIISYTLLPLLFSFLTQNKGRYRSQPVNLFNLAISVLTFLLFLTGTLLVTLVLPVLLIIPARRSYKKLIINKTIYLFSNFIVGINLTIKKRHIGRDQLDFSKPSVIISNHQSHLDLVLILMLHPKIIVLVNDWVWKNPFYGFIVRYADFYPVYKGLDHSFEKIRSKVNEGYSILAFPESHRTPDGLIKRFHQGAFSIADKLGVDIQPIMIHGAYDCLPKTEFFMNSGQITLKYFPKIKVRPVDHIEVISYKSQAKEITTFYRNEYAKLRVQLETPAYLSRKLIGRYVYKGPVLEWYLKVKLRLEKNYSFFHDHIPRKASIIDMGCGYGFLSVILKLLSDERRITGIDYDDIKIDVAKNIARNMTDIDFVKGDISKESIPSGDIYILNDVLHYLPEEKQLEVLGLCMDGLSDGGKIFLRDADSDLEKRTRNTKMTEYQSTRFFRFNKTQNDLSYLSGRILRAYVEGRGFILNRFDLSRFTSNITYIITQAEHESGIPTLKRKV